jgi:membrane associated rhomboid family serine protease
MTRFGFGGGLSRLGKQLLMLYAIIYFIELILFHWLQLPTVRLLQLYPVTHSDFHFWQVLTSPFIHDPSAPIGFLLNCLVLYFFMNPIEYALGRQNFLKLFYAAALGGALCGAAFSAVSGFSLPFSGMMPSLLALIVVFGLMIPDATVLLFFILPIQAKYIAYGTVIITALTFLAKANPFGAYHLGGIFFGYLYFRGPRHVFDIERIKLLFLQWRFERKKAKFQVIDGGKDGQKKEKPTYH